MVGYSFFVDFDCFAIWFMRFTRWFTQNTNKMICIKKKRVDNRLIINSFSVPLDVLFSKEFQDDLMRIWNLRYLIPDPEIYNKDTSQPTFH